MYRRKVVIAAATVFAIGIAFAAEPISQRSDRRSERVPQRALWVPGTNMLMLIDEPFAEPVAPSR